jgi:hypothetical protein
VAHWESTSNQTAHAQSAQTPGKQSSQEPEAEEDFSDQQTQSQHWTQDFNPRPTQSPRYAQTHDVIAFQKALWKSRN